MPGGKSSGAATPSSPNFDPGAPDFVPNSASSARAGQNSSIQSSLDRARGMGFTLRKFGTPSLALYSSSTWSPAPEQPIRSAGIPPKQSWDSLLGARCAPQPDASLSSPAHAHTKRSTPNSPLATDSNKYIRGSLGPSCLRYTQTEEYHTSSADASPTFKGNRNLTIQTDPIPQGPFDRGGHANVDASSGGSTFSQFQKMAGTPLSAPMHGTQSFTGTDQHSNEDQQSEGSDSVTISDHYTQTHPEQVGTKSAVWKERSHPDSIRRALKDGNVEWVEAFPGAITVLSALNPAVYQMPFGTRVVSIKTEYYRNILRAITCGKYSVMPQIAERIMKVWNSRESPSERVLFLFSINGSKRYCGLAEMQGQWAENDSIEGWEDLPDSAPSSGTFAIAWIYVKDVAFHPFNHIRQPGNGHAVGNMWNGMHFPSQVGRQVIKVYVETPATSSILGQPKSFSDARPLMGYLPFHNHRRGNYNSTSGARGGRGSFRGRPAYLPSSRQQYGRQTNSGSDNDAVPVPNKQSDAVVKGDNPPNLDVATSTQKPLMPGQLYTIIVNENDQFALVPADESANADGGGGHRHAPHSDMSEHAAQINGSFHGSRLVGDLHRPASSSGSQRPSTVSSSQSMFTPVVQMNAGSVQHFPVMLPQLDVGGHGSYGLGIGMQRPIEQTPTHRPASRGARSVAQSGSQQPANDDPPLNDLSINLLNAKYHGLVAEQFALVEELSRPDLGDMKSRLVEAKMACVLTEKYEVQAQLAAMGVIKTESVSPIRRDSPNSGDRASTSTSTGYIISPVRAEDGRRLRSVSKVKSPNPASETVDFDRAPGGSDRQKGHAKGCTDSWDAQVKKSIADLLSSPEATPSSVRPALETSTFFANSGSRKANNSPAGNQTAGTPSIAKGLKYRSFPAPASHGNRTPTISAGSQSFTFPAPAATPAASKSFDFRSPAPGGKGTPTILNGSNNFSFPLPAPKCSGNPSALSDSKGSAFLTLNQTGSGPLTAPKGSNSFTSPAPTDRRDGDKSAASAGTEDFSLYGLGGVRLDH